MDRIRIRGGRPLHGHIAISGAKNAALPVMAAALLSEKPLVLRNVPHLADIATMIRLLAQHGARIEMDGTSANGGGTDGRAIRIDAGRIASATAPYDIVRRMRASVLVLGPLLARIGEARVSLPGGCAIGTRPVDLHIKAMQALGAEIDLDDGYILARAPNGLKGGIVRFPTVSVGATESALLAASLADGESLIENAAREPEIVDLARCLNAMGARIEGAGGDRIRIEGVARLDGADHTIPPDRIETGTYAMAVGAAGGEVDLLGGEIGDLEAVVGALREAGLEIAPSNRGIRVARNGAGLSPVDLTTQPYPGFPSDLQAQFMALMCIADGASVITETIFENRFMHVPELARMGADIRVNGASATVRGIERLSGAPVMATDIRASVSLILAGLAAEGETLVNRVYHLDRGYDRLEDKLTGCGADIVRLSD